MVSYHAVSSAMTVLNSFNFSNNFPSVKVETLKNNKNKCFCFGMQF